MTKTVCLQFFLNCEFLLRPEAKPFCSHGEEEYPRVAPFVGFRSEDWRRIFRNVLLSPLNTFLERNCHDPNYSEMVISVNKQLGLEILFLNFHNDMMFPSI